MEKTISLTMTVETDKSFDDIKKAIIKGIYYGLDVKRIAPPKKVGPIEFN